MTPRYFTLLLGSYLAAMLGMTIVIELAPSLVGYYYLFPLLILVLVELLYLFGALPPLLKTEKIASYLRDSVMGWVGLVLVYQAFFPAQAMQLYLIAILAIVFFLIIFVRDYYLFYQLPSSLAVVAGTTAATWVYLHLVLDLDAPVWRVFGGLLIVALVISATVNGSLYYRRAASHGG